MDEKDKMLETLKGLMAQIDARAGKLKESNATDSEKFNLAQQLNLVGLMVGLVTTIVQRAKLVSPKEILLTLDEPVLPFRFSLKDGRGSLTFRALDGNWAWMSSAVSGEPNFAKVTNDQIPSLLEIFLATNDDLNTVIKLLEEK